MRLLSGSVLAVGFGFVAAAYGCGGKSEGDEDDGGRGGGVGGSAGTAEAGNGGKGAGGASAGTVGSSGAAGSSAGSAGSGFAGSDASGGTGGGSAGTSSDSGGGGDAGASGGSAGADGGAGTASGASGSAGSSGAGGAAGASSSGPECESADDCYLHNDCCTCAAAPEGEPLPTCQLLCADNACWALEITPNDVTCSFGRCVFSRSCDSSEVTCPAKPTECPPGQVHTVEENCWGPCVPATECQDVTGCGDCPEGTVCMTFESQLPSHHCIAPAQGCEAGNYCECLGSCSFEEFCSESKEGVLCPCPVC